MTTLPAFLAAHPRAVLVAVAGIKGSTPREAGAYMLVAADTLYGTIGGGALEFMAIDHARAMLAGESRSAILDVPLGPEIGQCCGGRMTLSFALVDARIAAELTAREQAEHDCEPDVVLFGAGHVGLALARALAPLPFHVSVIETRAIDADALPPNTDFRHVALPEREVAAIRPGGAVVIMTHDHALDFLIAREALSRSDLAYVGMIGSATKRATFASWYVREGGDRASLGRLVLPVGGNAVKDKRPAVIAAMVAAELLTSLRPSGTSPGQG